MPDDLSDKKLDELLFGQRSEPPSRRVHPLPDFPAIRQELQTHKNLTLALLWEEYKKSDDRYHYSRYVVS